MAVQQPKLEHGIVKQILSGDAIVVRGKPKGGPPPERTICLSNVTAPRLARRPVPGVESNPSDTVDQPYAWEAREFLRKKLIGKEVCFTVEYKAPGSGREYGFVFLGRDTSGENVTESIVAEGLVEVRRGGLKPSDENQQKLVQLEETAKAAMKGKWSPTEEHSKHVRNITWTLDNPRHFVSSLHQKPVDAVIEHVRDCCTVRAFLLPSFQYVTVMLTGIKGPMFKLEGTENVPEPYAEEAKFFVESRLLQRDVKIILEGTSGQSNLLGTVLHPNGNISELLLLEGFAHCADWSMGNVTEGPKKLRDAERIAKEKKIRRWKDYTGVSASETKENFTAKVVEVVNGDCLVVKKSDGSTRKIFLASIRPPRPGDTVTEDKKRDPKTRPRPLYDVPYMFEAREFLRKKLIGKKVNVQVDYIQPKTDEFPEKTCCTVTISNINVAEALVSKGLATVVRYRQDDDKRSSHYDDLLQAEFRAQNKGVGIHSKKEPPVIRVAEISGDVNKAKQFLPFLQRAGRTEGIVEFVASGSRLRLYIPRETCLITFLLAGIECPRGARPLPGGGTAPSDAYGEEALAFTKELALQHEVEVEVESMDKGGNFIGWMYIDGVNLSVALVQEGLSKIHFTAERSNYYKALLEAEEAAKAKKLNIWANYEEPKEETNLENEPQERKVNYKTVIVTEVSKDCKIYAQNVDTGAQLDKLMEQMRAELATNPPLPGSFVPKRGELCAAKFVDGEWYRARVERVEGNNVLSILYIDYGNREITDVGKLAPLPAAYHSLPPQAQEYGLACTALPADEDDKINAIDALYNDICNKQLQLNTEYKSGGIEYVTLLYPDSKEDVAQSLISEGLLLYENRKEKRLAKLVSTYKAAQDKAKNARLNLWRYGDFTEDDAREFGYQA